MTTDSSKTATATPDSDAPPVAPPVPWKPLFPSERKKKLPLDALAAIKELDFGYDVPAPYRLNLIELEDILSLDAMAGEPEFLRYWTKVDGVASALQGGLEKTSYCVETTLQQAEKQAEDGKTKEEVREKLGIIKKQLNSLGILIDWLKDPAKRENFRSKVRAVHGLQKQVERGRLWRAFLASLCCIAGITLWLFWLNETRDLRILLTVLRDPLSVAAVAICAVLSFTISALRMWYLRKQLKIFSRLRPINVPVVVATEVGLAWRSWLEAARELVQKESKGAALDLFGRKSHGVSPSVTTLVHIAGALGAAVIGFAFRLASSSSTTIAVDLAEGVCIPYRGQILVQNNDSMVFRLQGTTDSTNSRKVIEFHAPDVRRIGYNGADVECPQIVERPIEDSDIERVDRKVDALSKQLAEVAATVGTLVTLHGKPAETGAITMALGEVVKAVRSIELKAPIVGSPESPMHVQVTGVSGCPFDGSSDCSLATVVSHIAAISKAVGKGGTLDASLGAINEQSSNIARETTLLREGADDLRSRPLWPRVKEVFTGHERMTSESPNDSENTASRDP
jgi:hypothetical protein